MQVATNFQFVKENYAEKCNKVSAIQRTLSLLVTEDGKQFMLACSNQQRGVYA